MFSSHPTILDAEADADTGSKQLEIETDRGVT